MPVKMIFILLITANIFSGSYYVATSGNDQNPGTESQPWKTIQKAANAATAGDTILVKSGTYNERITFSHSGTPDKKIIFKAIPSRTVYMQGFDTTKAGYIRIEGFDITNKLSGYTGGGIWISSSNLEIVDNYFHDIPYTAVSPNWSGAAINNIYVANNRVYCCTKGIVVSGNGWLVENNEVERLQHPEGGDCDYCRFFGSNHLIRNNYFHGTLADEIGKSHTDGFQTFGNNGASAKNITIEKNIICDFHQGLMASGDSNLHDGIILRNNLFIIKSWGGAWGICACGIKNIQVYNNAFVNIPVHGVGFRNIKNSNTKETISSSGIIKNNIFYNCGNCYWSETVSAADSGYNLLYNPSRSYKLSDYPKDLVNIDPKFVDPGKGDYRLQKDSPAIDKGDPSMAPPSCGDKRIDIGACEYGCPDSGLLLKWIQK